MKKRNTEDLAETDRWEAEKRLTRQADLIIDTNGVVLKDRYGYVTMLYRHIAVAEAQVSIAARRKRFGFGR